MSGGGGPWRRLRDGALLLLALALAWEVASLLGGEQFLPGVWPSLSRLAGLLATAAYWEHIGATLLAFAYAGLISLVGGLFLGVWLGSRRFAGDVGEPYLIALYSLPKITFYPLVLLIFGLGLPAKVAFGALHGLMPIALFTLAAVRSVPPAYLKVARMHRLGRARTARHVLLPYVMPEVLAGVRMGLSVTLLGTLIGEMFASQHGLGYIVLRSAARGEAAETMATTVLLFAIALAVNQAMGAVSGAHRAGGSRLRPRASSSLR